uniref:ARID domain-containing protein n=1 Tax=Ditylenchus dipsaci TaxID=166011 RepID=A0A915EU61_9BILA
MPNNGTTPFAAWTFAATLAAETCVVTLRLTLAADIAAFHASNRQTSTRIPIMAKQVLDLYELYRLVVQHGGLVEIINKKLWREITKGLNLPNSITNIRSISTTMSAPRNLSCLGDLQAAIEGNRRDGRRNHHSSSTPNPPSSMATIMAQLQILCIPPFSNSN